VVRRDVGAGLLRARDTRAANDRLLGSPTRAAVRAQAFTIAMWVAGTAAFGLVIGLVSKSVGAGLSESIRRELEKFGPAHLATPTGYIGVTFLFFVLVAVLLAAAQIADARHEE